MNIKDIAALSGVSVSTVSKVINRKDSDISAATRQKVLEVVRETQYVPYSKIRKSIYGKSRLIGVLILDEKRRYQEILKVLGKEVGRKGYSLVVANTADSPRSEAEQIKILEEKNIDGLLLIGNGEMHKEALRQIAAEQFPCIGIGAMSMNKSLNSVVRWDEEAAAVYAMEYLLEKGHVDIGCIVSKDSAMYRGCKKVLERQKDSYGTAKIFTGNMQEEGTRKRLKEWLDMTCTAVFCEEPESVIYISQLLKEKGIRIPEDISVICGNDSRYLKLLGNGITAVRSPDIDIAVNAAHRMIEAIEIEEQYHKKEKELPLGILERGSVIEPIRGRQFQKLVVVGSMNMDVMVSVTHIPTEGETVIATGTTLLPGGKGANQAVGAGKLGSKVYMIGCLGNDSDGKEIYNSLIQNKVKTEGVLFDRTLPTGKAYINVAGKHRGESTIVIYQGANRNLLREHIKKCEYLFKKAKFCLISMEIPNDTAIYTISLCKRMGIDIILKPSGIEEISRGILDGIAYFVPNQKELELLVPGNQSVEEKAGKLWKMGVQNIIVTLGKEGCYLKNETYSRFFPAADFTSVDTTGGADAFISALAVYLSEGVPLIKAIGFATYCAGISVTRQGVQAAMPERAAVEIYRDDIYRLFSEASHIRREE